MFKTRLLFATLFLLCAANFAIAASLTFDCGGPSAPCGFPPENPPFIFTGGITPQGGSHAPLGSGYLDFGLPPLISLEPHLIDTSFNYGAGGSLDYWVTSMGTSPTLALSGVFASGGSRTRILFCP